MYVVLLPIMVLILIKLGLLMFVIYIYEQK